MWGWGQQSDGCGVGKKIAAPRSQKQPEDGVSPTPPATSLPPLPLPPLMRPPLPPLPEALYIRAGMGGLSTYRCSLKPGCAPTLTKSAHSDLKQVGRGGEGEEGGA